MNTFFDKLRVRRSVLERTTSRTDLPKLILYVEWLGSSAQRRVLDTSGTEHVLDDGVVESNFKQVSGKQAKRLLAEHWEKERRPAQEPYRAPVPAPAAPAEPAATPAKPPANKPATRAAKKPAKKAAKKKPAKKAAKKPAKKKAAKKKPAKKKKKKSKR